MNYRFSGFILSCLVTLSLHAQTNLVRNSSFEMTNTCATGAYWGIDTLWFDNASTYHTAQYWRSPNYESPDYYNSCQTDGFNLSIPGNWFGYQYPHTGNAYIGITTYSLNPVFNSHGEFREYIQTQTTKKLEPGALYCGQFYISLTYVTTHKYNAVVPDFDLGEPIDLCQDDRNVPMTLTSSIDLPNYSWSTGAKSPSISVSEPGRYWLPSFNTCGEKIDSIQVNGCTS